MDSDIQVLRQTGTQTIKDSDNHGLDNQGLRQAGAQTV